MPLAWYSARCHRPRHATCPGRLPVHAWTTPTATAYAQDREKKGSSCLNGIQTQSARVHNLIADAAAMQPGRGHPVRLSPQPQHSGRSWPLFDAKTKGQAMRSPPARPTMPADACNGYWQPPGWSWWTARPWCPPEPLPTAAKGQARGCRRRPFAPAPVVPSAVAALSPAPARLPGSVPLVTAASMWTWRATCPDDVVPRQDKRKHPVRDARNGV